MIRKVSTFRGWVMLADSPDELTQQRPHSFFTSSNTLCHTFSALPSPSNEQQRAVLLFNACQTASGASYYVLLGGSFQPSTSTELKLIVQIGYYDSCQHGLDAPEAAIVQKNMIEQINDWPHRLGGEIIISHALMHAVDSKNWAWGYGAKVIAEALRPENSSPADEQVVSWVDQVFR